MREKIFKNLSLKVLSAVIAVILWTVIVNIYDPTTSYTFSNVAVQLINTENLTDKNYSFEVTEGSKISVYISGPKSVVTDLKASDIVATADLSKVNRFTEYVDIKVSVVKNGQVISTVEATPRTTAVKLNIENRENVTFEIKTNINGTVASGYAVINENINPAAVKVTGPNSLVSSIESAVIEADITGATGDVAGNTEIRLYDADGNEVSKEHLELSQAAVDYNISISKIKTVPIDIQKKGTPENGYIFKGFDMSHSEVTIAGPEDALSKISEIVIGSDNVNISGLKTNKSFSFNLADYVDDSIIIMTEPKLQVIAKIEQEKTRNITLNTNEIIVNGLPDTMKAVFADNSITFSVMGEEDLVNAFDASSITASVDVTGHNAGIVLVNVSIGLPDGIRMLGTCTTQLELQNNTTSTGNTGESTAVN